MSFDSLEEELWLLVRVEVVCGLNTVGIKETVVVDPLHHFEWRKALTVVETCRSFDRVGGRSAHHGGLDNHLGLVITLVVFRVSPDPQGSFVVWSEIISSDKFLAQLIIVVSSSLADPVVSPFDGGVVNVGTSVTSLIGGAKISICLSALHFNRLSRGNFGLDLRGCGGIEASIQLVEEVVLVL